MKKIFGILTAAFMLTVPHLALADTACSFECIAGTVIMKGTADVPDLEYSSAVTVKVTDEENNINYYDVVYTDENNRAEFYYKNNAASGRYTCTFTINALGESVTAVCEDFKDKDFQEDFVKQAKAAADARDKEKLSFLISDNDYWLKTDRSVFNELKEPDNVFSIMINDYEDYKEACNIKEAFERCAMLQNANENGADGIKVLYESDKVNRLFNFDAEIPMSSGENVFDKLSESTKSSICKAAAGNFTSSKQFVRNFAEQTLLTAISNAANYNEVKIVLEAYKAADLISYSGTLTTANYKALTGKSFSSYSEVSSAIANLKKSEQKPSGAGGGGGSSSGSSVKITVSTPTASDAPEIKNENNDKKNVNKYFDDIEDSKWAMEAIDYLYEKEIINGCGERAFEPNRTVTRAEAAKMITLVAGIDISSAPKAEFSDTESGAWYEKYINAVCEKGYFKGLGDGSFGVCQAVTREQAAAVIYRVLCDKNVEFSKNGFVFEDDNLISSWAEDAVYSLYGKSVLNGRSNNMFCPHENMTRAECAVLIFRAVQQIE